MDEGYPELGRYLNATGRPIVYSCSWPAYQIGQNPNYKAIAENCNLWRNWDDIDDSWDSVLSIIDYYGNLNTSSQFAPFGGPGQWYLSFTEAVEGLGTMKWPLLIKNRDLLPKEPFRRQMEENHPIW